jgi:hypothetical protein
MNKGFSQNKQKGGVDRIALMGVNLLKSSALY